VHRVAIAVACLLVAVPLAADGQPAEKIARIAVLRPEHRPIDDRMRQLIAALRTGLEDEGYTEGRHYRIEYYSPPSGGDVAALARTVVRSNVDVIHASGHGAVQAARNATTTIPIVAHDYESDPVAAGFVVTIARPGRNITGMFLDHPEIAGKLLDLLKTGLPGLRRIGVVWDPLTGKAQLGAVEQAARALEIEINVVEARAGRLPQTVRSAAERKGSALLLLGSPMLAAGFATIAEAAAAARVPTIAPFPSFARLGGLMAYGPDAPDQHRQEGRMIAKILRGTKPADLPVERPTKFYFVINLKTARALGLALPPALLQRADYVIE
jgi:ABC-type uncharacterized transport system substrate-binding protein